MIRFTRPACSALVCVLIVASLAAAQVRVEPQQAKGGVPQGEPWTKVPDSFQILKGQLPEWPLPTNRTAWETSGRLQTRETLLRCMGEMPARPDPRRVKVIS